MAKAATTRTESVRFESKRADRAFWHPCKKPRVIRAAFALSPCLSRELHAYQRLDQQVRILAEPFFAHDESDCFAREAVGLLIGTITIVKVRAKQMDEALEYLVRRLRMRRRHETMALDAQSLQLAFAYVQKR